MISNFREPTSPPSTVKQKNHIRFCKALCDFEASSKSDFTFKEGDIVKVLRTKTPSGGDDGWWEEEIYGKVGLFPSLIVEPLKGTSTISPIFPYSRSAQPQKEILKIIEPESISLLEISLKETRGLVYLNLML